MITRWLAGLVVCLLALLTGKATLASASWAVMTTNISSGYVYDGAIVARSDLRESETGGASPAELSGSLEGSASHSAEARAWSTARFATGVATNALPCASFRADTLVLMADGSKKPIGEIEVGDKVVATDPVNGATSVRTITRLWTHIDDDLLDVVVLTDDGVETIHTTDHHRFWNDTRKEWVEAKDLTGGERLLTTGGDLVTIGALRRVPGAAPMLDLTVEYDHTFYVALKNTAILVHNQTCRLTSAIDSDPGLVKAAKQAGKSVQSEIDSLTSQLNAGNLNPGIGTKKLFGNISYLRGTDGVRVFFRPVGDGFEILAKASKANESQVIAKLEKLYG
jgi:Pretoxin HINT domain